MRQGVWLRGKQAELTLTSALSDQLAALGKTIPPLEEDRALDAELRELIRLIHGHAWPLYG